MKSMPWASLCIQRAHGEEREEVLGGSGPGAACMLLSELTAVWQSIRDSLGLDSDLALRRSLG